MEKYSNNRTGNIATVINTKAAGLGHRVGGITMVIFTYENVSNDFPFVIEHREFYETHTKL